MTNGNGTATYAQHDAGTTTGKVDLARLERIGQELLEAIGEDPTRPGIVDTPARFARFWKEFIDYDPGNTETVFDSANEGQIVSVQGIRVWSLCEHHLMPFWADIDVAYIPTEKVLGLSKFARIAHQFAHSPQIQERLTRQIADEIQRVTGSPHVAVKASGQHLCMIMRGIKTPGVMTSTVLRGKFQDDPMTRQQFIAG